jgi:hypothetical protein
MQFWTLWPNKRKIDNRNIKEEGKYNFQLRIAAVFPDEVSFEVPKVVTRNRNISWNIKQ